MWACETESLGGWTHFEAFSGRLSDGREHGSGFVKLSVTVLLHKAATTREHGTVE
ncbi:MAG: hypothetical protein WDO74_01710 [Pseudomonadota bacterium]